ncbi:MAG: HAD hydrolase-like protein, partial [Chlamydiae bacterium]|nr:HAD hydrolase-like protein [Chlamydiota bacterium]
MNWHDYDLICFDFDGVLVDSEQLHFDAYKQMCAKRGISLKWDEVQYAKFALYSADGLKKALLKEYEQLQ